MLYGKLENDAWGDNIVSLHEEKQLRTELLKNVTLPEDIADEDIIPHGYVCIEAVASDIRLKFNETYEFTANFDAENDVYVRVVGVQEIPADIAAERKANKWEEVIDKARAILADTDFTQLADNVAEYPDHAAYRAEVRAIQNSDTDAVDPFLVDFPEEPAKVSV